MNWWKPQNKTYDMSEYMKKYREDNLEKIRAVERSKYYKRKYGEWFTSEELVQYGPILDDIYKIKKIVKKNESLFPNLLQNLLYLEQKNIDLEPPKIEEIPEETLKDLEIQEEAIQ